ncbi:MAG: hypothetical protein J6N95_01210 [Bacilli bacterium]|nr:hypothetical protein [Bacilli bacterium]
MEVEMKAWVSPVQVDKLLNLEKSTGFVFVYFLSIEKLYKKDVYYSFNGDVLKEPKRIIRIRTENSALIEQYKETVDVCKISPTDFTYPAKTYLTVKERHTDESGIETNNEYESILDKETENTLTKVLEIANFKPYFTKSKGSISFHVKRISDNKTLHCEIVAVNGLGPLLEVEVFAPGSKYDIVEDYMCESVADAKELLKEFFWKVVQINEDGLEKRPWPDIINGLTS